MLPQTGHWPVTGNDMRMWLLLILLMCLAGALYLGFGTPEYGQRSAELVKELEGL